MPLVGFESSNHPQLTRYAGSNRHVDDRALPAAKFAMLDRRSELHAACGPTVLNQSPAGHGRSGGKPKANTSQKRSKRLV